MKKEILIVTNYFPPESGAASNRIQSMVQGFLKNGYNVSVVCPFPNYPEGNIFENYKGKLYCKIEESFGFLFRLWIWPTKSSNKFIRLISMLSFSFSLMLFFLFKKTSKKVLIQYSPVFVGFTGLIMSRVLRKKVILNVSDLWPLAGLEMGLLSKGFYYNMLSKMESFCFNKSELILGQSEEILTHIKNKSSKVPLFLYRNYPDFKPPKINKRSDANPKVKIVYAGLLGVAQGLYKICNEVTFSEKVSLHIYGTGPEAEKIQDLEKPHIYYNGSLDREKLHVALQNYHIGFVPLANRIYGSVPSKIFELSRLGVPVLYFAGGEGGDIVENNLIGYVVTVNNTIELQNFVDTLSLEKLKEFPKTVVQERSINGFNFENQFSQLIGRINSI